MYSALFAGFALYSSFGYLEGTLDDGCYFEPTTPAEGNLLVFDTFGPLLLLEETFYVDGSALLSSFFTVLVAIDEGIPLELGLKLLEPYVTGYLVFDAATGILPLLPKALDEVLEVDGIGILAPLAILVFEPCEFKT